MRGRRKSGPLSWEGKGYDPQFRTQKVLVTELLQMRTIRNNIYVKILRANL